MRKRGKTKDTGKQLGVITRFNEEGQPVEGNNSDDEGNDGEAESTSETQRMHKAMTNGSYVYIGKRKQFGVIRSKKQES